MVQRSEAAGADKGRDRTGEPEEQPSLGNAVYQAIKQRILENRLRPGNKLGHQDLAEMLGVSRTPVREALERLAQEGFVVHRPRRGCFVSEIDVQEACELYDLREALEVHALRRTAKIGLTRADLSQLSSLTREYAELVRDDSTRRRLIVDRDLHLALASKSQNRLLSRSLESVFERLILKLRVEGFRTSRGKEALDEHVALMSALRKQDFGAAETVLIAHLREGRERLLGHIEDLSHEPVALR
jgi:DNA-binding GntR family transcriptional regulator